MALKQPGQFKLKAGAKGSNNAKVIELAALNDAATAGDMGWSF